MTLAINADLLDGLAIFCEQLAPVVAKSCSDSRTGGCFFICDAAGNQLLHKMVGEPEQSKMSKYREFSREKAERLLHHQEDTWSMQSRDPEKNRYGGAYRSANGFIVSFSGFSEIDDQLFAALIACLIGWDTLSNVKSRLGNSEQADRFEEIIALPR